MIDLLLDATLAMLLLAIIIGIVAGVAVFLTTMAPEIAKRVDPGPFEIAYKACCPPGVGCNDPNRGTGAKCRRRLAQEYVETADEALTLDELWSTYHRTPNAKTLAAWESYRDSVIAGKLRQTAMPDTKTLLGGTPSVRGEVL